MTTFLRRASLPTALAALLLPLSASAQIPEMVGSRALGMGGAFVAVADDSSATWWNPAGLAQGPFLDLGVTWAETTVDEQVPANRERASSFALTTPPFGFSYYRFRMTGVTFPATTGHLRANRQDGLVEVSIRSLSASQIGATFVQALGPGVHAGTTLKYVRGTPRPVAFESVQTVHPSELLDHGDDLDGGDAEGHFDLDVGVLAIAGPIRIGGVVRNITEPTFGDLTLQRQVRLGGAFDVEETGGTPLTIAGDVDVLRYETALGERRVVAFGAEQWLFTRRLGLRGGARFNTVGSEERAVTGGISIAVRAGLFVDAHVVGGGAADEGGWGLGARVSF